MRSLARTTILLALMVLGVGSVAGAQISIRIGPPPQPRAVRVQPARPGANFVWVDGYWYPVGRQYKWHNGYWTRPPYAGATWVAPRHAGQEFFTGYWGGNRARINHNHRTDRSRARDYRR
jgi:WXXGXW repeat (2 copies)